MDIQKMLDEELKLLQKEFGCAEVVVEWRPRAKNESEFFGKQKICCGEVIPDECLIIIYLTDCKECLHTLRHEFLEYYYNRELLENIITAYNNMRKAAERTMTKDLYSRKESVINNMVRIIEFKRKVEGGEKE